VEEASGRVTLAASIIAAHRAGHQIVLLHGGGNQMRSLQKALGIADRYHDGLRITDAATAEVALMVLGGSVNRTLVAALQAAGLRAVGLTGADGNTFSARRKLIAGVDLGYVGESGRCDPALVELLLDHDHVPVIGTVAPLAQNAEGPRDRFYNINADEAAGPLAVGLRCDATLFLTDVTGVLGRDGQRIARISPSGIEQLIQDGTIKGGMLPKVRAALLAAKAGCRLVKILPGAGPDPILGGLSPSCGTAVVPNEVLHA
jgi:acetylglutamate kinase